MAWAPGKGVKSKELKDFWEVDLGVSYIPYDKLPKDVDLVSLEEGGVIDEDSLPEDLREKRRAQEQQRTQGGPGLAPSTVAGGGGADVVAAVAAFPGAAMTTPVVTTMAAPGGAATAVAMVPPPVAQFGIPLPPGKASSSRQGHAAVISPPFILSFHVFLYFASVCIPGCRLARVFQKPWACDMCLR
uniref:Putative collagen alpha-1xi chain isoform x3 n=1 Tax=Ixodes ricinus TaxID=34613 RepID=A0A147BS26_IXORI